MRVVASACLGRACRLGADCRWKLSAPDDGASQGDLLGVTADRMSRFSLFACLQYAYLRFVIRTQETSPWSYNAVVPNGHVVLLNQGSALLRRTMQSSWCRR
jgi:hypothetical protein